VEAADSPTGPRPARYVSRRSLTHARGVGASRRTVVIALAANASVLVIKLFAGLLSGSTALLAEAAHSLADTVNQGFLLASISLSLREPSEGQPFGHGQERFLWTFVAAVSMFVAGAVFAVGYGTVELISGGGDSGGFLVAWVALILAAIAEGTSWMRAVRQIRGEAREAGMAPLAYVRVSRDPNVKMVLFEDSAALLGVALAALGIGLHQLTGRPLFDSLGSIAIGVLLIVVAVTLARDVGHLLVGAGARPDERAAIETVLRRHPDVLEVRELLTMVLGPASVLVAARIDLDDRLDAGRVERTTSDLDDAIRREVPDVTEVFLDATPPGRD